MGEIGGEGIWDRIALSGFVVAFDADCGAYAAIYENEAEGVRDMAVLSGELKSDRFDSGGERSD
jgi:hypothetical protein